MATKEQIQKVVEGFQNTHIMPPPENPRVLPGDAGKLGSTVGKWTLVDTRTEEMDVNWPGDFLGDYASFEEANFARIEWILNQAGLGEPEWEDVQSSNIKRLKYRYSAVGVVSVEFNNGAVWDYTSVSKEEYNAVLNDPISVGKAFDRIIKKGKAAFKVKDGEKAKVK